MSDPQTVLINSNPRPRVLIFGFEDESFSELIADLLTVAPTVRKVQSLGQIRPDEWDALITNKPLTLDLGLKGFTVPEHLFVLYVYGGGTGQYGVESRSTWRGRISVETFHVCQELKRVRGVTDSISELVHEELEPVFKTREDHHYFYRRMPPPTIGPHSIDAAKHVPAPEIEPFMLTGDDRVLAGRYMRTNMSEAWLLPGDTPNVGKWVRLALTEWRKLAPSIFPGVPLWTENEHWSTAEEKAIRQKIIELRRQRDEYLDQIEASERLLKSELETAITSANEYERTLLTAQADDLKNAVIRALSEIGFNVVDADADAKEGDHLEDLRVSDPDVANWIALGEVKGYTKGAKTEALTQFLRFNLRFVQENGRSPDACWYIVNQFLGRDPSSRQIALNGKDDDVEAFSKAGGLILDTRDLFSVLMQVRGGSITATQARQRLRSNTGRFSAKTL